MSSKRKSSPYQPVFSLSVDHDFLAIEHIYEPPRSKSKFRLRLMYIFTHHMTWISPRALQSLGRDSGDVIRSVLGSYLMVTVL
jgi:hypothetical protein